MKLFSSAMLLPTIKSLARELELLRKDMSNTQDTFPLQGYLIHEQQPKWLHRPMSIPKLPICQWQLCFIWPFFGQTTQNACSMIALLCTFSIFCTMKWLLRTISNTFIGMVVCSPCPCFRKTFNHNPVIAYQPGLAKLEHYALFWTPLFLFFARHAPSCLWLLLFICVLYSWLKLLTHCKLYTNWPLSWSAAAPLRISHPPEPLFASRLSLGKAGPPPGLTALPNHS